MDSTNQTYPFIGPGVLTLDDTGDMYNVGYIEKDDGAGGWTSDHDDPKRIGSHEESVTICGAGNYRVVYTTHSCKTGPTVWSFV